MNTTCTFFVIATDEFVDFLGRRSFESFSAARAFLREFLTANIDAANQMNAYVAMICQING